MTGAAQGIGRATAETLGAAGVHLIVSDRQAEKLPRVAEALEGQGLKALCVAADLSQPAQVQNMVQQGLKAFGTIHILVNNVGGSCNVGVDQIEDVSEELWDKFIDANLKSAYLWCQAVVPHMKERRRGSIINFSAMSAHGTFGSLSTSATRPP